MEAKPAKLNYKASNIAAAELKYGLKFFKVLNSLSNAKDGDFGMSDMLFLYVAGGGSVDTFDKLIIDGTESLMIDIMEGLTEGGFLGQSRNFDRKQVEAAVKEAMKEISRQVSQTSGED